MPLLPDVNVSSINDEDPKKQLDSVVSQVNEWGRLISNENLVTILRDASGTRRYMIGLLPDKTFGLKVSKQGVDVVTATDTQLIRKDDFSTQIFYDNSNSRILIGFQTGGF